MSDRLSTGYRDWINERAQNTAEDRQVIENLLTTLSTRNRPDIVQGTCDKVSTMLPAFHIRREVTAENVALFIDMMKEVNEKQKDLLVVYSQWYPVREELIKKLFIVADKMDEYRFYKNLGILGGSSASLVGGTIVSLVAGSYVMFGLFYPLLVLVGLALNAGGSTISVVSALKEIGFSKRECDEIQYLLDDDRENTKRLIRALNDFNGVSDEFKKWIKKTHFTNKELRACAYAINIRCTTTSLCSVVMSTCAFIKKCDKNSDDSIKLFTEIFKDIGIDPSYIQDKKISSKELEEVDILGLCLGITIKCIPVASVIIDSMTIYNVLGDFKKGSKSEAADKMRTLAKKYRQGKTEVEDIMNTILPNRNN